MILISFFRTVILIFRLVGNDIQHIESFGQFAEDGINTVQVVASAVCGVCLPLLVCKDQVSRRCQDHGIYPGIDGCYRLLYSRLLLCFSIFKSTAIGR